MWPTALRVAADAKRSLERVTELRVLILDALTS